MLPAKLNKEIEASYGSPEELTLAILEKHPGVLESKTSERDIEALASELNLRYPTLLRFMRSTAFASILDQQVAMDEYALPQRKRFISNLVRAAEEPTMSVMTKSGPAVIDKPAKEMIVADEYLRALQGRPLETSDSKGGTGTTINISFAGTNPGADVKTIEVYSPAKAGDLPPQRVQPEYQKTRRIPRDLNFDAMMVEETNDDPLR